MNKRLPKLPKNTKLIGKANDDHFGLDHSQQIEILKGITKVAKNPKPRPDGYGEPLHGDLEGFCKIKFLKSGIRVVYRYIKTRDGMA